MASLGFSRRTVSNTPVLAKIISLRRGAASLLGYRNWAEYELDIRMAKTTGNVMEFLEDLEQRVQKMAKSEKGKLLNLKEELEGKEAVKELYTWDASFYKRLWVERNLQLGVSFLPHILGTSSFTPFSFLPCRSTKSQGILPSQGCGPKDP